MVISLDLYIRTTVTQFSSYTCIQVIINKNKGLFCTLYNNIDSGLLTFEITIHSKRKYLIFPVSQWMQFINYLISPLSIDVLPDHSGRGVNNLHRQSLTPLYVHICMCDVSTSSLFCLFSNIYCTSEGN